MLKAPNADLVVSLRLSCSVTAGIEEHAPPIPKHTNGKGEKPRADLVSGSFS